jgi:hypothetical protein
LTINSGLLFQLFKYTIYVLLAANIYLFYAEESAAAMLQFSNGIDATDLIEAFSATIDTAAWVVLLLMFELETYILEDRQFTRPVTWSLHGLRALCYLFIVYAFYGYIQNLNFLDETRVIYGVTDLCSLQPGQWSWAVTLDEYADISAANCASLSDMSLFHQFNGMNALVDSEGLREIRYLAWVDVINAAVWLLVVLVLEVDVRLQEHNRFEGLALKLSTAAKFVLYSVLLLAAVYWGFKGDFVDFWDAFLWLVAFVFIELNVFEWRQEEKAVSAEII